MEVATAPFPSLERGQGARIQVAAVAVEVEDSGAETSQRFPAVILPLHHRPGHIASCNILVVLTPPAPAEVAAVLRFPQSSLLILYVIKYTDPDSLYCIV